MFPHPAIGFPADEPPGFRCPGAPRSTDLLDLVIVAGQTQDHRFPPGLRDHAAPCDLANVRAARDQCAEAGVPFVIARLGSRPFSADEGAGWAADFVTGRNRHWRMDDRLPSGDLCVYEFRSRDGRNPDEWPEDLAPYAVAAGPLAGGEP